MNFFNNKKWFFAFLIKLDRTGWLQGIDFKEIRTSYFFKTKKYCKCPALNDQVFPRIGLWLVRHLKFRQWTLPFIRAGHLRYFLIFFTNKKCFHCIFYQVDKKCKKSFFIIEKIKNYRKCPALKIIAFWNSANDDMMLLFLSMKLLKHNFGKDIFVINTDHADENFATYFWTWNMTINMYFEHHNHYHKKCIMNMKHDCKKLFLTWKINHDYERYILSMKDIVII